MPGMNQYVSFSNKIDGQQFVGLRGRNAQHSGPTAFLMQLFTSVLKRKLPREFFHVTPDVGVQKRLNRFSLIQQSG